MRTSFVVCPINQGYLNQIRRGTSWTLINMMQFYHSLTSSRGMTSSTRIIFCRLQYELIVIVITCL